MGFVGAGGMIYGVEIAIGACLMSVSVAIMYICYGVEISISEMLRFWLRYSSLKSAVKADAAEIAAATAAATPTVATSASYYDMPGAGRRLPTTDDVRTARAAATAAHNSAAGASAVAAVLGGGDSYRIRFLIGLGIGACVLRALFADIAFDETPRGAGLVLYFMIGIFMSVGSLLCGGDCSGHAVSGVARRSFRSFVFVAVSLSVAMTVNYLSSIRYVDSTDSPALTPAAAAAAALGVGRNSGGGAGTAREDELLSQSAQLSVSYAQHPLSSGGFVLHTTAKEVVPAFSIGACGFLMVLWSLQSTDPQMRGIVAVSAGVLFAVGSGLVGCYAQSKVLGLQNIFPVLLHAVWPYAFPPGVTPNTSRVDFSLLAIAVFAVAPNLMFYRMTESNIARPFLARRFTPVSTKSVDPSFILGACLFGIGYGALGLDLSAIFIGAAATMKPHFLFAVGGVFAGERIHRHVWDDQICDDPNIFIRRPRQTQTAAARRAATS